jgi:hypothetical protein
MNGLRKIIGRKPSSSELTLRTPTSQLPLQKDKAMMSNLLTPPSSPMGRSASVSNVSTLSLPTNYTRSRGSSNASNISTASRQEPPVYTSGAQQSTRLANSRSTLARAMLGNKQTRNNILKRKSQENIAYDTYHRELVEILDKIQNQVNDKNSYATLQSAYRYSPGKEPARNHFLYVSNVLDKFIEKIKEEQQEIFKKLERKEPLSSGEKNIYKTYAIAVLCAFSLLATVESTSTYKTLNDTRINNTYAVLNQADRILGKNWYTIGDYISNELLFQYEMQFNARNSLKNYIEKTN